MIQQVEGKSATSSRELKAIEKMMKQYTRTYISKSKKEMDMIHLNGGAQTTKRQKTDKNAAQQS